MGLVIGQSSRRKLFFQSLIKFYIFYRFQFLFFYSEVLKVRPAYRVLRKLAKIIKKTGKKLASLFFTTKNRQTKKNKLVKNWRASIAKYGNKKNANSDKKKTGNKLAKRAKTKNWQ